MHHARHLPNDPENPQRYRQDSSGCHWENDRDSPRIAVGQETMAVDAYEVASLIVSGVGLERWKVDANNWRSGRDHNCSSITSPYTYRSTSPSPSPSPHPPRSVFLILCPSPNPSPNPSQHLSAHPLLSLSPLLSPHPSPHPSPSPHSRNQKNWESLNTVLQRRSESQQPLPPSPLDNSSREAVPEVGAKSPNQMSPPPPPPPLAKALLHLRILALSWSEMLLQSVPT